ncbi:hypothetical protein [Micromonospora yangpuensis]|uniref:Uncharacterized protein n=1 Tax=Micromonospora yangpuensis TaxID=683228 RepID=A0A1C6UZB6_9ACTN|nr:hypothetical protein [Micromonospora yangpuensis]GGL96029.1 hypothetical protein GCM10012279_11820 [Micromonospora yangpuensis]SCL59352.1 hypothetical protein GA0070617_4080 [Micromonospora yangpuensis]
MSSFDDYVALARELSERRRAGQRDAAADTERRRGLHAAADQLDHRLAGQAQRLEQLGRTIDVPPPPYPPADAVPPAAGPAPAGTAAAGGPAAGGWPDQAGAAAPAGSAGYAGAGPVPVAGGGAAALPGRSGVGAYPDRQAGPTAGGLPATVDPAVPAQRAAAAEPGAELELARRLADDADRYGQQAETLAHQPALLPGWSPLARALAVYTACASVGVLVMLMLVVASGVGLVDGFTLGAWMCAGLPALSFFAGYLILGQWGSPALHAGTGSRYVHFGFLICFVLVPVAYCAYLVLVRTLR